MDRAVPSPRCRPREPHKEISSDFPARENARRHGLNRTSGIGSEV